MLDLLIPTAYAMAGPAASGAPQSGIQQYSGMIMMLIIFGIFYVLLIRPQQKKAKEHKQMLDAMKKGDKVITNGGIYGEVFALSQDVITLIVADGVKIKVARGYIAGLAAEQAKEG